jgi:streptogramin lyase
MLGATKRDVLTLVATFLAGAVVLSCGGNTSTGSCENAEDCPEGMFCDTIVTGTCQQLECTEHTDCPIQYLCGENGECYDPTDGNTTSCFPNHAGCPCSEVDLYLTINCIPPEQIDGVDASCHIGTSTCDGERYGPCIDVYREDCDGIIFGSSELHPNEDNSENVIQGVEGEIQLDPDERQVDFGYLWIANTGENTVSKIDVETGREVARYASAIATGSVPGGPFPYPSTDPYTDCHHCPSRTAVDFNGDAFVANRAFNIQGSVTKIANDEVNCPDLNSNGVVDTSWDANADGVIDAYDPAEFLGEADECILWTSAVGGVDGLPRALAIDSGSIPDYGSNGNVWVGIYNEQRAIQLNGDTGEEVTSVTLTNGNGAVHPYGAAVDAMGFVWFTSINDGNLAKVDTIGGNLVEIYSKTSGTGCGSAYGIAVDVMGRIWLGGFDCNTADRFDPADLSWASIDFSASGRGPHTRGIAPDLAGTVWVAHTGDAGPGYVTRFDAETLVELESFALPHHLGSGEATNNTIGVGIDRNGACWAVSRDDGYVAGTATRITPGGTMDSFPVGLMPYTYSDFTGFGLSTVTRPSGWYNMIVAGCEDQDPNNPPDIATDWQFLTWNEIEPTGTNVRMRVKVANTLPELDSAPWFGPFDSPSPGVDLNAEGIPDSNFMLLQVLLSSTSSTVTPSFLGFTLDFDCGGTIVPE